MLRLHPFTENRENFVGRFESSQCTGEISLKLNVVVARGRLLQFLREKLRQPINDDRILSEFRGGGVAFGGGLKHLGQPIRAAPAAVFVAVAQFSNEFCPVLLAGRELPKQRPNADDGQDDESGNDKQLNDETS